MAEYIDRDTFLEHERAWYCENCDRRKNSKGKTVYEIGEAPCRACDIGDVLDALEDYPAADAIEGLSKYADTMRRLKCEGWYMQQTKFHDGYHSVSTMPLPEPPKEET